MFLANKKDKAQRLFETLCAERENYLMKFGENGNKGHMNNFEPYLKAMVKEYQDFKDLVWEMNDRETFFYQGKNYNRTNALTTLWSFISMLMRHYQELY